ncbi:PAS domain-containing protein, partial [Phenylobacterium sp.]|uniref:PAS domain-containing protein n=1 Tax=Phenylobacterium sp. TaxID=1871053 RepID=UPI002E32D047
MDPAETTLGRPAGGGGPLAGPGASQGFLRLLILSALLLLSLYTVFALWRLSSSPPASPTAAALYQRASELAARADVEAMALQGGALAAVEVLQRAPSAPLDAAETALRAASGAAAGAVVVSEGQLAAAAGKTSGVRWLEVVRAAEASGQEVAFTVAGVRPALIAVVSAPTSQGRRWVALTGDPNRLLGLLSRGSAEAFAGRSGQFVAAAGETAIAEGAEAAFGRPMKDLDASGPLRGARPDGAPLDLAGRPAAGGALVAVAAAPAAPGGDAVMREQIAWLLLPLGAAFALGLMLLRQSRRAEDAQKAFIEHEQRFRLAVEAARCGIWEWDIVSDKMFMSDVTGAIFGWGGGGVVDGADVIERVSPEHRDRLRNALTTAAVYGAFDVSFRVPGPHGGRPIWIDARGQAFGQAEGDSFARIIGVALDVTEERMAQARAQAAENRLRDAIESVSEA